MKTLTQENRLRVSLLLLRIGVFIVMFIWTLDKFLRPEHASAVYESFYFLSGFSDTAMYIIATVEMIMILGFVMGYLKTLTYGFVLVVHAISTFSSMMAYLTPFEGPHLLFFAAWPMLAACITLFLLRKQDTLLAINKA